MKMTSGPVLDKPGNLAGLLTSLEPNDVLFIDEIHRLSPVVEEYLYSAMEDYRIDIMIESGPNARSIQIALNPFTLIGATTRAGSLSAPLRDRFGVIGKFELYTPEELKKILRRSATLLNVGIDEESLDEMAKRSRGTPRVANRMLKRIRDFSQVKGNGNIDLEITREGLEALGVDELGLEELDRDIILTIIERFGGGPVGIDTIAASLGEEKVTLEDVNEPFLIQSGLLYRTQKGRMVSREGYKHFGLDYPEFEEQIEM
jgi:Holliday junction DNA helicase RuvB